MRHQFGSKVNADFDCANRDDYPPFMKVSCDLGGIIINNIVVCRDHFLQNSNPSSGKIIFLRGVVTEIQTSLTPGEDKCFLCKVSDTERSVKWLHPSET